MTMPFAPLIEPLPCYSITPRAFRQVGESCCVCQSQTTVYGPAYVALVVDGRGVTVD